VPRCPFCGEELDYVIQWALEWVKNMVEFTSYGIEYSESDPVSVEEEEYECPACEAKLPLRDEDEVRAFSRGELEILFKEKARVKGNFALYDGKVYEIVREEKTDSGTEVLIAKRITDEPRASIIAASF